MEIHVPKMPKRSKSFEVLQARLTGKSIDAEPEQVIEQNQPNPKSNSNKEKEEYQWRFTSEKYLDAEYPRYFEFGESMCEHYFGRKVQSALYKKAEKAVIDENAWARFVLKQKELTFRQRMILQSTALLGSEDKGQVIVVKLAVRAGDVVSNVSDKEYVFRPHYYTHQQMEELAKLSEFVANGVNVQSITEEQLKQYGYLSDKALKEWQNTHIVDIRAITALLSKIKKKPVEIEFVADSVNNWQAPQTIDRLIDEKIVDSNKSAIELMRQDNQLAILLNAFNGELVLASEVINEEL